jgi:hypothetical protein
MIRAVLVLATVFQITGCSIWPWGSTYENPVPANLPAGQQAFPVRADSPFSNNMQSDFRR